MATNFYLANSPGQSCGPGDRYSLSQNSVFTMQSEVSVNDETTWNVLESRGFVFGPWSVSLEVAVGTGGGAPSRVGLVLERRNSACGIAEEILSFDSGNLTAGATNTVTSNPVSGEFIFSAGDLLLLRVVRTNGNRDISVIHNTPLSYVLAPAESYDGGTRINAFNGMVWTQGELKRWDGSSWVPARAKLWNGTTWVEAP